MAQITSGLHAILSKPSVYDTFQNIMGAHTIRQDFVRNRIRPFPNCRILDIGCGTARILDYLPEVDYFGFDLSESYIKAATKRYGNRAHFNCALVENAQLKEMQPFDVVIAFGLLHHLDDVQAQDLMKLAWNALRQGGRLVTIDPCFSKEQHWLARFLVSKDRGQNVRFGEDYCSLPKDIFSTVIGEINHRIWIPYSHWIMECRK